MDIAVIAEGIEEPEELEKVRLMGAHYAQGYLLGRPSPYFA
jgi:EAL domain-containing protein (putative c-di-GMP-specific phosphodiesterase class I)